jgi:hypothetical protein
MDANRNINSRILTIDKDYARSIGEENAIYLLPHLGNQPDWSISKEKYEEMIPAAVKANKKIAKLFANKVFSPKLGYKEDAAEYIFYMSGTPIVFLLCDRLIRLNRLLKYEAIKAIHLPDIHYKFDTSNSAPPYYYDLIKSNPIFNQWILNKLLPDIPRTSVAPATEILNRRESREVGRSNIIKRVFTIYQKEGLLGIARRLAFRIFRHSLMKSFALRSIPYSFGPHEAFGEKKFFWPSGPLYNLEEKIPTFTKKFIYHKVISRSDFFNLDNEIQQIFREFFQDCHETESIPAGTLIAASNLLVELLSDYSIEYAPQACDWAIRQLEPFKTKIYLTGFTVAGVEPSLFTFAAKQLDRKVVAMQHSAWGGYLAYGALITEWIIMGSDDYITFGWHEQEHEMSSWHRRSISLPSPRLSYYGLQAKKNKSTYRHIRRHILLATGFLYRFPSIPNSSLKLDTINIWAEKLRQIVKSITSLSIKVTIVMYNSENAALHRNVLDSLIEAGDGLASEHFDHDFRIRALIFSGAFNEHYDAVIWDLPAGGFSEAISANVPTFALCDTDVINILPEGVPIIEELRSTGIIFENQHQLRVSLDKFYSDETWYQSERVQSSIRDFQNKFCQVSPTWDREWLNLLNSYKTTDRLKQRNS